MPGVCGCVGASTVARFASALPAMVRALSYGRFRPGPTYVDEAVAVGCAIPATSPGVGLTSFHAGPSAIALVHGYLVRERAGSGAGGTPEEDGAAAWSPARQVYHEYVRSGPDCVEQLDGVFSLAIWDKERRQLALATDRLGLQPLYYAETDDGLVFASEVKALRQPPGLAGELDESGVADFLSFGYILGDKTLVKGVQLVPPATVLLVDDGRRSARRYWQMPFPDSAPRRSDASYDEAVYEAIAGAVDEIVEPERRYVVALSGGLDSRWLAATLGQRRPDTGAVTFGLAGCDDVRIASQVARQIGLRHVWVPLTEEAIIAQMEEVVHVTDGMFSVLHAYEFTISQAQLALGDTSTAGLLADSLFGNRVHPQTLLLTRGRVFSEVYRGLRRSSLADHDMARVFGPDRYRQMEEAARESLRGCVAQDWTDSPVLTLDRLSFSQKNRRFVVLGQVLKQARIDGRYPFAHRRVVETATRLPVSQRLVERAYRRTFTRHFPALAAITWQRTLLPPSAPLGLMIPRYLLLGAAKRVPAAWLPDEVAGFQLRKRPYVDYARWMKGRLGQHVGSILLGPGSNALGLYDRAAVGDLIEAQVAGRRDVSEFLGLLVTIELWSRAFAGSRSNSQSASPVDGGAAPGGSLPSAWMG